MNTPLGIKLMNVKNLMVSSYIHLTQPVVTVLSGKDNVWDRHLTSASTQSPGAVWVNVWVHVSVSNHGGVYTLNNAESAQARTGQGRNCQQLVKLPYNAIFFSLIFFSQKNICLNVF